MSLFAAYHSGSPATRASLNDQLAGNLCRCTGYRPILEAALATCDGAPDDRFAATAEARARRLRLSATMRDVFVGDEASFFAAPAEPGQRSLRFTRGSPTRRSSPGRPTSDFGSPSTCAI